MVLLARVRIPLATPNFQKKEDDVKRLFLLMLVALFVMGSTLGCNAPEGTEDIPDEGQNIQDVGN